MAAILDSHVLVQFWNGTEQFPTKINQMFFILQEWELLVKIKNLQAFKS